MTNQTRICNICNQEKPYNPAEKRNSIASGFYGMRCWSCQRISQYGAQARYYNKKVAEAEAAKKREAAKGAV